MRLELIIKNETLFLSDLHDAREYTVGDGKPRWSAAFCITQGSENDKKIRDAIGQVAREEWPKDWERRLASMKGQKTQYCYLDGEAKLGDRYNGEWILATHRYEKTKKGANTPPLIVDKNPRMLAPRGKIYPGCKVNAKVEIYAQGGENPGIRAGFSVVQYVDEGEEFAGGSGPNVEGLEDLSVADEVDIA